MLHKSHADAADHSANALAARRLRVNDSADAVATHDAPHPGLSEIGVDGDFDEYGPERMHRESLARVPRFRSPSAVPSLLAPVGSGALPPSQCSPPPGLIPR